MKRALPVSSCPSPSAELAVGYSNGSPESAKPEGPSPAVELDYAPDGELTRHFADRVVRLPPERFAVFWAGFVRPTPGAQMPFYWLRIPLVRFLEWRLPAWFRRQVLAGHILVETRSDRVALDRRQVEQWHKERLANPGATPAWTWLEIEARLARMADSAQPSPWPPEIPGAVPRRSQIGVATQIALHLHRHFPEPVYWQDVAKLTGRSLAVSRKCFARCFGMSLHAYLLQLRLARAKQLLTTANTKIIDVALETGFPTMSNFYRCFQSAVGQTPSAYRAQSRSA